MYKAIKRFEVNGQTFQIGDDFPVELFEERLLRGKKIQVSSLGTSAVLTEDVKPKKEKAPKESKETKKDKEIIEDEILTDDSSNVEVKIFEEDIIEEDIEKSEDK